MARFRRVLVPRLASFTRSGRLATNSTRRWSRNGTRASTDVAMLMRSILWSTSSTNQVWTSSAMRPVDYVPVAG